MKLSMAVDKYIDENCAGKLNETPVAYRTKLQRMITFLGDRPIHHVKPEHIDAFRLDLLKRQRKKLDDPRVKGQLSIWTIRTTLQTVRQFWTWGVTRHLVRVNPAAQLKLPPEPPIAPKAIAVQTFEKLVRTAAKYGERWERARNVSMLYVLRDTGGRISGLLSARLEDLDLEAGLLTVREKGNHERDLPLNDPTCDALRQWLEARSEMMPDSDYLFIGMHGKPLSRSGVYGMLDRLREKGGIYGRMNPHAFRHAFARDSLRNGANISEVSQLMGHSTPTVTLKYYARWDKNELHAVHRRVSPGARLKVINLSASE